MTDVASRDPTAGKSATFCPTVRGPRPSITGGLREAQFPTHDEQGPMITGRLTRKRIPRTIDYQQAGERDLLSEQWEEDDLVANLVEKTGLCDRPIQEWMVWHLLMCEDELGLRVGEGSASGRTTSGSASGRTTSGSASGRTTSGTCRRWQRRR